MQKNCQPELFFKKREWKFHGTAKTQFHAEEDKGTTSRIYSSIQQCQSPQLDIKYSIIRQTGTIRYLQNVYWDIYDS